MTQDRAAKAEIEVTPNMTRAGGLVLRDWEGTIATYDLWEGMPEADLGALLSAIFIAMLKEAPG